jgi:hypothetical protein
MWFVTAVFIGMCGVVMDPTGRGLSRNPPRVIDKKRTLPRVIDKKRTLSDVLEEPEFLEEDSKSGIVDNDPSKCDQVV